MRRPLLTNELRIGNYGSVQTETEGEKMTNDNLRYEIARLDAKLDIIINTLMNGASGSSQSGTTNTISTSEIALMRSLTTKQHCALQMLTRGSRNQDIAHVLDVAENTVKLHVRAVCKKMGVKNRQQAATVAHDIYRNIDSNEYMQLSGGIPLDWADNLRDGQVDPYQPLYAPTRKDK